MTENEIDPNSESANATVPDSEFGPIPESDIQSGGTAHDQLLKNWGFWGLVAAQFLGTANDNIFRWLIVLIGKSHVGPEREADMLSLGLIIFTLPFILFATHAGYLADRFSKRTVIVWCKFAEILVMLAGVAAIASGQFWVGMFLVFCMGTQSALFAPAKFGAIPELVTPRLISVANGIMGLATVSSTAIGMIVGYWLFDVTGPKGANHLWTTASVVIGLAVLGWFASMMIRPLKAAAPEVPFPWIPLSDTAHQFRHMRAGHRGLFIAVCGIAFFWGAGALAQVNIDQYGSELGFRGNLRGVLSALPLPVDWSAMNLDGLDTAALLAALVVGMGAGSILAGLLSIGRVETGMTPIGAAGLAVSAVVLYFSGGQASSASDGQMTSFVLSAMALCALGTFAGVYCVPLDSFVQSRSSIEHRGAILAGANLLSFVGMMIAGGAFYVMTNGNLLGLNARQVFLILGIISVPVAVYAAYRLQAETLRFIVRLLLHCFYRIRITGMENVPAHGGALLVANHISWIDGLLFYCLIPRTSRFLVWGDFEKQFILGYLSRLSRMIPVKASDGPKALIRSLQTARETLLHGELVGIFPEGQLSRTGNMNGFQRGVSKIIDGTSIPVIPVYLDGLWGSIFSFSGGTFFWKWPKQVRYPLRIVFGTPLVGVSDPTQLQLKVRELSAIAMELRKPDCKILPRRFLQAARSCGSRSKVADSTGANLSGRSLLMRVLGLTRILQQKVLAADERYIGVLLPPSAGGVVVNAAIAMLRRVSVNLNYTASVEVMNACVQHAGVKRVLTSRKFIEKLGISLSVPVVYLEDFATALSTYDKIVVALQTFATPLWVLERQFGLTRVSPDDELTIIFTSGSTGEPKGVMLSHYNVASNVDAADCVVNFKPDDVIVGLLPFFHSFGYTVTLWTVLSLDLKGAYHFNPLDARQVGGLTEKHKGTILLATPTFLRNYIKRCEPAQFATLKLVIVGAEKLPADLATAFEERFGNRPLEGYGCTELSPLVSCNLPDYRDGRMSQLQRREGSVGKPLPGLVARIVDPDTGTVLNIEQPGMLQIKGPNVMVGYLHRPDLTAKVIHDGWYTTGDIAKLDSDGFITITDRLSRFSKIAGEMVPHIKVEAELTRITSSADDEAGVNVVVTSVPDAKRGERLVVVHRPLEKSIDIVLEELGKSGLPNLWLPGRDSFVEVNEIPVLGTGKLDLKGIKSLAMQRLGDSTE